MTGLDNKLAKRLEKKAMVPGLFSALQRSFCGTPEVMLPNEFINRWIKVYEPREGRFCRQHIITLVRQNQRKL